eukprot:3814772-Prymnesium_polylepis.1
MACDLAIVGGGPGGVYAGLRVASTPLRARPHTTAYSTLRARPRTTACSTPRPCRLAHLTHAQDRSVARSQQWRHVAPFARPAHLMPCARPQTPPICRSACSRPRPGLAAACTPSAASAPRATSRWTSEPTASPGCSPSTTRTRHASDTGPSSRRSCRR